MQILKEEVRQRILDGAITAFLTFGYKGTSMRMIADRANVTPGNVYSYFEDKEALLDAVLMPVLDELHTTIARLAKEETLASVSFDELSSVVTDLYLHYKDQFLLLMTKAEGTKYALAKQQIISEIGDRLTQDWKGSVPSSSYDPVLFLTIATALVEGLLTIFTHVSAEHKVKELVFQFLQLMFYPLAYVPQQEAGK